MRIDSRKPAATRKHPSKNSRRRQAKRKTDLSWWPPAMSTASLREGWDLFATDNYGFQIQNLDDPESVAEELGVPELQTPGDDHKALSFVADQALRGSARHVLALFMDGQDTGYQPPPWLVDAAFLQLQGAAR